MTGVGCPGARRAESKLKRPAQSRQSQPGTQSWGLSLQGHHSIGQFPVGGLDEKPITERAVNRFASSSLSWNFLVFPSFPRFMTRLLPCSRVWEQSGGACLQHRPMWVGGEGLVWQHLQRQSCRCNSCPSAFSKEHVKQCGHSPREEGCFIPVVSSPPRSTAASKLSAIPPLRAPSAEPGRE